MSSTLQEFKWKVTEARMTVDINPNIFISFICQPSHCQVTLGSTIGAQNGFVQRSSWPQLPVLQVEPKTPQGPTSCALVCLGNVSPFRIKDGRSPNKGVGPYNPDRVFPHPDPHTYCDNISWLTQYRYVYLSIISIMMIPNPMLTNDIKQWLDLGVK